MQSTFKAATLAFFSTILFSSVNFAQNNQNTITFTAFNPQDSRGAVVQKAEAYSSNPGQLEVDISNTSLKSAEVQAIIVAFNDNLKAVALQQVVLAHPKATFFVKQEDLLAPSGKAKNTTFKWVKPENVSLDLGDGHVRTASAVAAENIHEGELVTGNYRSLKRYVQDNWNCKGVFNKEDHCSHPGQLANH
jgi:hypothetical protein